MDRRACDRANRIFLILCGLMSIGGSLPLAAQTITSITNAASGLPGGVSPGEIVLIGGAALGPATLVAAPIAGGTTLPVSLDGVSVSFSGTAAPIVYVSATGTTVQVPYELAGFSGASVTVTTRGGTSPPFNVPVVLTAPGLFTLNYSGSGQVVALSFGAVNSPQNPVPPGSSVVLYATGQGVTFPAGVDGVIGTTLTISQPAQPISVQIAGINAPVMFAGSAPGDIAGVLEIGVLVPSGIPSNIATPVTLTIGGVTTTQRTTLAVHR
jgi:uncharacterized protein (TIGR03437 family)